MTVISIVLPGHTQARMGTPSRVTASPMTIWTKSGRLSLENPAFEAILLLVFRMDPLRSTTKSYQSKSNRLPGSINRPRHGTLGVPIPAAQPAAHPSPGTTGGWRLGEDEGYARLSPPTPPSPTCLTDEGHDSPPWQKSAVPTESDDVGRQTRSGESLPIPFFLPNNLLKNVSLLIVVPMDIHFSSRGTDGQTVFFHPFYPRFYPPKNRSNILEAVEDCLL